MKRLTTKALLAVSAATLAAICVAGSATAGFPGANSRLVFQDYTGNDPAIATMNADGTGPLTYIATPPAGGTYANPASSADGTKVAFDDGDTLWIVNADGTGLHQVRAGLTGATEPTWSPDGSKLAFTHADGTGSSSIGMVNADGTGFRIHLASFELDSYDQPAWSPDGTKIAYRLVRIGPGAFHSIAVVQATGNVCGDSGCGWDLWTPENHPGFDSAPNWSPDGTQLVFNRFTSPTKHVLRVSGPLAAPVDLTPGSASYEKPAWSPDGTKIVATGDTFDLWVMKATNGSGLTQLTTSGFADMADWIPSSNTPTGNPTVTLPGTPAGTTVTVSFASVTAPGTTTLTVSATGPAIPAGFTLNGSYYELSTTATFTSATLCISSPGVLATSTLWHFPGPTNVTGAVTPPKICSTPLTSFSPFAIADPVGDTTPPTLTVSHVADGANGWNKTAPVAMSINASDTGGSGVAGSPVCTDAINGATAVPLGSVVAEGVHVIHCTVSDHAGNSAAASDTVKIDTKAPVVSYTGNAGTYTTAQTVNITCTVADPSPSSGVASPNACVNISGPASGFALGSNVFSVSVTDTAGNVGHGTTSFTVTAAPGPVTVGALCLKTKLSIESSPRYLALRPAQKGVVQALANALCQRLNAIGPHFPPAQKAAFVRAYSSGVQALVPLGWLTQAQATTLIGLANQL